MNVKEQQGDKRPYWKVAVSLFFSLLGTALFIGIGIKAIFFFMPFVIGWFLSFVASPLVKWLEKKLNLITKISSALVIIVGLGIVIALFYLVIHGLWTEIVRLIKDSPKLYQELESGLVEIGTKGNQFFSLLPEGIQSGFYSVIENLDQEIGTLIGTMSEPTVMAAGNFAKKIPSVFISVIVTVISAYFFIADRENILVWAKKITPDPIVERMSLVMSNLKYAIGGYFKAQFKIMVVVFAILLVGFGIMGLHFSILLALLIAFLDLLPFFGTGTALIPWGIYKFLVADYKTMIALIVLYAVTQLVRQVIQPKLVGDSIGLNPLFTLVLLYVGYKVGSVLGMIFAVPVGMILYNLIKAGAFDYILDDIKILVDGILELRKKD